MTLRRARKIGSERVLLLGLLLANRFLGVALPEGVRRRIQDDRIVQSLAAEVYEQRFVQIQGSPSIAENMRFYLRRKSDRSISSDAAATMDRSRATFPEKPCRLECGSVSLFYRQFNLMTKIVR